MHFDNFIGNDIKPLCFPCGIEFHKFIACVVLQEPYNIIVKILKLVIVGSILETIIIYWNDSDNREGSIICIIHSALNIGVTGFKGQRSLKFVIRTLIT